MNILNLNTMKTIKLLALFFISSLVITSCSSDDDHNDDDHDHEEEVITTLIYTLTNDSNSNDVVTLTYQDLDGEGGSDGTTTVSGSLTANSTYSGEAGILNETEDPAEDVIAEDIVNELEEHEFFYSTTISGITITKDDVDGDGNPVGIETTLTTGDAGTGTLTVILKHEPKKPNNDTVADAGGSTDIERTFNIVVE